MENEKDFWGSSEVEEDSIDDYWAEQGGSSSDEPPSVNSNTTRVKPPLKLPYIKLGYKMVGVIVAVVLLFMALIINGLSSMKVTRKVQQPKAQVNSQSMQLNYVSEDTVVDYSVPIKEVPGVVTSKSRYAVNGQVIYCLNILLAENNTNVKFFCNYGTYGNVGVGDSLLVRYQNVTDKTISVMAVMN